MTTFMFYLHKRLFVQEYGRAEMMDILAKKVLKSIARSTGARLSANRWVKTLEFLYRTTGPTSTHFPESLQRFLDDFKASLRRYTRTHSVSIHRTLLILDYIDSKITADSEEFLRKAQTEMQGFAERNDSPWFTEAMGRFGFQAADCGHLTESTYLLAGTQDNWLSNRHVCFACAQQSVDSGDRVLHNGRYFLASQVVSARTPWGTEYMDRRNPELVYTDRYRCWHTRDWTPYSNIIDNYHTAKTTGFTVIESPWYNRHRRAFGLELEIQVRGVDAKQSAGKVHEVLNPSGEKGEYCFFERDGSIGDGFELITQPAGLDVHREKLSLFLTNEDLKRGLRSHEGGACGLHIHVGREFVTQAQIYRVQSFLNDVRNEGLIRKISRRYSNSYARIRPELAKLSPQNKRSGERYEALNVTNHNTIEFRIFRGSLKYESVIAAIEFVDSLLAFCMPGQTSIMDFNAIGFRKFITRIENSPDTKFLRGYLRLNQENDIEHRLAA